MRSNRISSAHRSGNSIGVDTNCMPMPSSVVVSHTFSIAAPNPNTE